MIHKKCLNCGSPFKTWNCEIKRGRGKFCSRSCHFKYSQSEGGFAKKTGTMIHKGYILEWNPNHPNQQKGYVPQHRCVMERKLGRILEKNEIIHHVNHCKHDNRIENLQIVSSKEHMQSHHGQSCFMNGKKVNSINDICKELNIAPVSFRGMRKRRSLTNQQTVDHYLKKQGLNNES